MTDLDPIAELVDALERDGKPTLAWMTRWEARARELGARDVVAAAWGDAPTHSVHLGRLLAQCGDATVERLGLRVEIDADGRRRLVHPNGHVLCSITANTMGGPQYWAHPSAFRTAVPNPPTLGELLADAKTATTR
jgi:hypothetical protein